MKKLLIIIATFFLCSCGSLQTSQTTSEPYPSEWKSIVLSYIKNNYNDPYSIRDSEASQPFRKGDILNGNWWVVCIRNNAKNKFGGYTGRTATRLDIKNGQVEYVVERSKTCNNVSYESFPLD